MLTTTGLVVGDGERTEDAGLEGVGDLGVSGIFLGETGEIVETTLWLPCQIGRAHV